ncbi:hypothetical protein J6590_002253 [Homalodisca vitripennis]|nr:hypothetical protein J6590_002253 [Homalodisca vitripennis]
MSSRAKLILQLALEDNVNNSQQLLLLPEQTTKENNETNVLSLSSMDTNPAPSLTSLQAVDPFVLLNNENEYIMEVESESNKEFATDENIVWNDGITNQDFQSYDISFSSQGLVAEEEDSLQELAVSGNADIPSPGTSVLSSNVDDTDIDST